jgi:tryptophan synthase beta subunit
MSTKESYQHPNEQGYYGPFGGAYIPEMLHRNVEELRTKYLEIIYEDGFQKEFQQLLKDYVGRPTPLFLAERLSKQFNVTIYLKREDLCHTGHIRSIIRLGKFCWRNDWIRKELLQRQEPVSMAWLRLQFVH